MIFLVRLTETMRSRNNSFQIVDHMPGQEPRTFRRNLSESTSAQIEDDDRSRAVPRDPWVLLVSLALTTLPSSPCSAQLQDEAIPSATATTQEPAHESSRLFSMALALKEEQYRIATDVLRDFPDDFDALRVMGFAHSSHGNLEEMATCWERCRELQPDRPDIHDQLGRYAMKVERYDDAIDSWQTALKLDPNYPQIQQRIGEALLNQGKAAEALAAFERELERAPSDSQAFYLKGEACFQLQDYEAAKQSFTRAVERMPEHAQAYYGLIKTCRRLGDGAGVARYAQKFQELQGATFAADREVRRQYDDLREMRRNLAVTCLEAGRLYQKGKNDKRAEALWTRLAELDPDHDQAHQLLASLYLRQRRGPDALRELEHLTRLHPRHADYYQQIGFLQARMKNLRAAEAAFKKMVEIAPDEAAGTRALAKFYLNTKQQASLAHELAVQAVRLEPVAESYFVLAWSRAALGRPEEALDAVKVAIRLDPNNITYRKLYESIDRTR